MNDQNFHEIQLSGKQLLFGFMSAVVLLVIIFLLGVSVGRGVRDNAPPGSLDAALTPGAAGDTTVATDPPAPSSAPPPGTLTYPDVLKGQPPPAAPKPPADKPAAPVTEPPAVTEKPPPPAIDKPVDAGTKPAAPPAADAGARAAGAPAGKPGQIFLQVGAYRSDRAAAAVVTDLKAKGFTSFVVRNPPYFRVRLGPFSTTAQAEQEQARLRKAGQTSSVIR